MRTVKHKAKLIKRERGGGSEVLFSYTKRPLDENQKQLCAFQAGSCFKGVHGRSLREQLERFSTTLQPGKNKKKKMLCPRIKKNISPSPHPLDSCASAQK